MRFIPILAIALLATACAAGGADPSDTPDTSTPPVEPAPSPSASPSLAPESAQPSLESAVPDGDRITGILGADSVEGGCGYIQADDGTRYEILYPDGWQLTLSPLQLTAPDGEVVARAGDEVTVIGSEATDMGSICQIGPIFRATSVET
ncbi:MAG: hypothetical protein ACRDGD_12485 [Candidatus Limnocylindria bacterium]